MKSNSEKVSTTRTPPNSPKNAKRFKNHHSYKQPLSPPPLPLAPIPVATVPVLPVSPEEIKCEPRADSPTISDESCDDPVGSLHLAHAKIPPDSDIDDKGKLHLYMY